jgi:hypothetical protein
MTREKFGIGERKVQFIAMMGSWPLYTDSYSCGCRLLIHLIEKSRYLITGSVTKYQRVIFECRLLVLIRSVF